MIFPDPSSRPTSYTSPVSFVTWNRLTDIRPSLFPSTLAVSARETLPISCLCTSPNKTICQGHPPQIESAQPTGQSHHDSDIRQNGKARGA